MSFFGANPSTCFNLKIRGFLSVWSYCADNPRPSPNLVHGFHARQARRGQELGLFNVIVDFNREALCIEVNLSLPPELVVIRALRQFNY